MDVGEVLQGSAARPPTSAPGAPVQAGGRGPVVPNLFHFARLTDFMLDHFGDRWFTDGEIDVRYVMPLHVGDTLTPRARVTSIEPRSDRETSVSLQIWCENQDGAVLAQGTAQCVLDGRRDA